MQPPQGSYPQNGYSAGQDPASVPPWNQLPTDQRWVQRPIPGQQAGGGTNAGQVPPPVDIYPDSAPQYAYPNQEYGAAPQQPQSAQIGSAEQPSYQPPKTGLSRKGGKRGRGGYIILAVLVVIFAGLAIARLLSSNRLSYGYVRYDTMSSSYTGDAVLVRDETVYSQEGVSQIDFEAEEGADVQRGTLVATIYTSGFNAKEWVTLQNYRDQIKAYHKVLVYGAVSDTTLQKRMTEVQARAMEVQRLVHGAQGSISLQETLLKEAMSAQQIYIKQKFPDDQKLSRLYDDENTQLQRISTWTKQFATTANGLVSFYTDGYEQALNMSTYADFSPAEVRSMFNGQAPKIESTVTTRNSTDIYRLVRKEKWAILMLVNEKNWTPMDDRSYKLVLESYDNVVLNAKVESYTRSGGELLIRLVVEDPSFLPDLLYLRSCQVRLGENVNSLMVPSNAIYVQGGRKGVVIITEGGQYWTGVEVVSDDGNKAYVIPDNAGVLYDGVPVRLF